MRSLLLVQQNLGAALALADDLRAEGYLVELAVDGAAALDRLDRLEGPAGPAGPAGLETGQGDVDMVLLDLSLTDVAGTVVLSRWRTARPTVPVIVLNCRPGTSDVVAGLDQGASDCLVEPVRVDELLARIRSRLAPRDTADPTVLSARDLSLDVLSRRVVVEGEHVYLSARESALLETLMRHPDEVLSRERLLGSVWGFDSEPLSNVVDVYVRCVRQKIGARRITTVRGVGYCLA